MASTTNLKLKFGTMYGEKTWTIKYANTNPSAEQIANAMNTMITNGSIYKYPPLTKVSAEIVTTTTQEVDVS